MPLASAGLRALRGQPHTLGNPSRSIHTPAFIPRSAPRPGSTVQGLFKQARTFLSTVVSQLTAPGTFATPANIPHASRSFLEASYHRTQTIQQRAGPVTRFTLSRPLSAPFLPRPPAVGRSVAHVGLGTARNFSSTRPIFENLVQNVPVAGRAFCEADWDVKMQKEREMVRMKKHKKGKENKRKSMLKAREAKRTAAAASAEEAQADFDKYFPATAPAEVTTYLLIPLAPTPTSRLPLSMSPSVHTSNHPLLPLSYIASIHRDHATHSLRVSTVFARLDAANVFQQPGVSTAAYGGPGGLCTILEVKFVGWSEARVRSVLGEAGTGWCVLEEVREDEHDAMEDALSEMSFDTSPNTGFQTPANESSIDPAASFVLPTLDFSASFASETSSWARQAAPATTNDGLADLQFHNEWTASEHDDTLSSDGLSDYSDSLSDLDIDGSAWGTSLGPASVRSSNDGWASLNFSSSFVGRMQRDEAEEPREAMF